MSEYDVSEMEVEDQSEDGEITKSPHKHSPLQLSKDDITFRYVSQVFGLCETKIHAHCFSGEQYFLYDL